MLSYRHAYHAGNFADVTKHIALVMILRYMTQKPGALCYLDTHAGAGSYDLQSAAARKTAESSQGIAKILGVGNMPEPVSDYVQLLRQHNAGESLHQYPGSPWIAAQVLRAQDRLIFCELHGSDFPLLQQLFADDRRVYCHAQDAYRFVPGLMPPPERRGLVFMDPSYELPQEYDTAVACLRNAHRKFSSGTFALWYPILDEVRSKNLRQEFEQSGIRDVLHFSLCIADSRSLPGMYGSGMIVVNPPWTLRNSLQATLPWLTAQLGVNNKAAFEIEQWTAE